MKKKGNFLASTKILEYLFQGTLLKVIMLMVIECQVSNNINLVILNFSIDKIELMILLSLRSISFIYRK